MLGAGRQHRARRHRGPRRADRRAGAHPGLRRPRGRRRHRGRRLPRAAGQRAGRPDHARGRGPGVDGLAAGRAATGLSHRQRRRRSCPASRWGSMQSSAPTRSSCTTYRPEPACEECLPDEDRPARGDAGGADLGAGRRSAGRAAARLPGHGAHLAPPRPAPRRPRVAGRGAAPARLRAQRSAAGRELPRRRGDGRHGRHPRAAGRRRAGRPRRPRLGCDRRQRAGRPRGVPVRQGRRARRAAVRGARRVRRPAAPQADAEQLVHPVQPAALPARAHPRAAHPQALAGLVAGLRRTRGPAARARRDGRIRRTGRRRSTSTAP